MYQALRRSRVTLNSHIDLPADEAGNMRLFEATGAGVFLLTDFKENLHTLFEPGREVAVWRSVDDCLAGIERALRDDAAPRAIRARRPGAHHGAAHLSPSRRRDSWVLSNSADAAMKIPRMARRSPETIIQVDADPAPSYLFSTDYRGARRRGRSARCGGSLGRLARRAHGGAAAARLSEPDRRMPSAASRGSISRVAAEAVAATGIAAPSLLDVGCGSGYYSEIFAALRPRRRALHRHRLFGSHDRPRPQPTIRRATFGVADATSLPYADGAFDIVFNGVSLMHIVDYQAAVREAARVAARYCIFHSVPVFDDDHPTTFLQKYAYGAPVVEVVFRQAGTAVDSAARPGCASSANGRASPTMSSL